MAPALHPPLTAPPSEAAEVVQEASQVPADDARVLLADSARLPSGDSFVLPPGCSCKQYPEARGAEKLRWQAKLPPGAAPFEGTKSKSQSFAFGESGDRERMVCEAYLARWWASQNAST